MSRHHKSGRTVAEPDYVSSSTSVPFDPTGKGPRAIKPYGRGSNPHDRMEKALHKVAPHPSGKGHMLGADGAKAARHGQAPPATSLPGQLGIIEHPMLGDRHRSVGIPGIMSSTSLGPEQRSRLVAGIIESGLDSGRRADGAVHTVQGRDSTAYNAGMVHIAGSGFK